MAKKKTCITIDEKLWERFKAEVARRHKGRRKTVPPLSEIVEDLVRVYVNGVHRDKVPIYVVASMFEVIGSGHLLKVARKYPELAIHVAEARPSLVADPFTLEVFEGRRIDPRTKYERWFVKKPGRLELWIHDPELEPNYTPFIENIFYILGEDLGGPYFNGWVLDALFTEGYANIVVAELGLEKEPIPAWSTVTFSIYNKDAWTKLLSALGGLIEKRVLPVSVYSEEYGVETFTRKEEALDVMREFENALRFLEALSRIIPSFLMGG